jgi:hypothetical protein
MNHIGTKATEPETEEETETEASNLNISISSTNLTFLNFSCWNQELPRERESSANVGVGDVSWAGEKGKMASLTRKGTMSWNLEEKVESGGDDGAGTKELKGSKVEGPEYAYDIELYSSCLPT